ncbi:T/G mismatch-specific endonuclease [Motilibacter rhizosphaerae]|uniref:T/G mismatch-specific endonuclease n=1 Tax=Motilibacter rhizosphaerae TaxID=598652 RepID=A0A4Q7NP80_9ACTN|nr:T/G mismatch-specific endonuclease [Motilibacter rhizosphaerae]
MAPPSLPGVQLPPAPPASSEAVRRVLSRNRRRDTAPELAVRRALRSLGIGYRVDWSPPGTSRRRRADIVVRRGRVAGFVDGCFWHSCSVHLHMPKANAEWWELKLASVVARDRDTDAQLLAAGWLPVRVREHEDPEDAALRIALAVEERRASA